MIVQFNNGVVWNVINAPTVETRRVRNITTISS